MGNVGNVSLKQLEQRVAEQEAVVSQLREDLETADDVLIVLRSKLRSARVELSEANGVGQVEAPAHDAIVDPFVGHVNQRIHLWQMLIRTTDDECLERIGPDRTAVELTVHYDRMKRIEDKIDRLKRIMEKANKFRNRWGRQKELGETHVQREIAALLQDMNHVGVP